MGCETCGGISNGSAFLFSLAPVPALPWDVGMLVGQAVFMVGSLKMFKLLFLLNLYMHILVGATRLTSFINNPLSLSFPPPSPTPLVQR